MHVVMMQAGVGYWKPKEVHVYCYYAASKKPEVNDIFSTNDTEVLKQIKQNEGDGQLRLKG
jgi:hypothetical protein